MLYFFSLHMCRDQMKMLGWLNLLNLNQTSYPTYNIHLLHAMSVLFIFYSYSCHSLPPTKKPLEPCIRTRQTVNIIVFHHMHNNLCVFNCLLWTYIFIWRWPWIIKIYCTWIRVSIRVHVWWICVEKERDTKWRWTISDPLEVKQRNVFYF